MKGITAGLDEARSDVASVKYQGYLTAGVERWREYRDQLKPLGKKPVLFVMLNSTAEADDVGDYLRVKYPAEFGATDDGAAAAPRHPHRPQRRGLQEGPRCRPRGRPPGR